MRKAYRRLISMRGVIVSVAVAMINIMATSVAQAELGKPVIIEHAERLDEFLSRLDERRQGRGQVRMTHIGDSHIIADFWTGEMRERLQKRFGDGGRGFVLGGEMWRSYSQRHIRHRSRGEWEVTQLKRGRDMGIFGPGGAALICDDPECITTIETKTDQRSADFDRVDIFTLGHGQGGRFKVEIDQQEHKEFDTFSPWLSVQRHQLEVELGSRRVSVSPLDHGSEVWLFGFSLTDSRGGLIYDSIGLNGAQAQHLLKNTDRALVQSFDLLDTQLVILSYGINELFDRSYDSIAYQEQLKYLLGVLRGVKEKAPSSQRTNCLLTGPFAALQRGREPKELDRMYEIQRELSDRFGCAFWDARAAMGGDLRPWQRAKIARRDGVHLSRKGYYRVAELFEESLLLTLADWRSRRASRTSSHSVGSQPIHR